MRKFLLNLRYFVRYRKLKRQLRRTNTRFERERLEQKAGVERLKAHYERLLAEERVKVEKLLLASTDRVYQAYGLAAISPVVSGIETEAERRLNPAYQSPEPDIESTLVGAEKDFYEDSKESFIEYEMRYNNRTETEALHIWNTEMKVSEVARAKSSIIR